MTVRDSCEINLKILGYNLSINQIIYVLPSLENYVTISYLAHTTLDYNGRLYFAKYFLNKLLYLKGDY